MGWTVACFCGNIYAAPPDRCEVCGRTLFDSPADGPRADGLPARSAALDAALRGFPEPAPASQSDPGGS